MQKTKLSTSIILIFATFFIFVGVANANKLAAKVNGVEITIAEVNRSVSALSQYRQLQNVVLENLIVSKLLYQEGKKAGIVIDQNEVDKGFKEYVSMYPEEYQEMKKRFNFEDADAKAELAEKLMIQKFVAKRAKDLNINVTEEELKAYYDAQPDAFNLPERIRTSHILLKCGVGEPEAKAAKLKEQIIGIKKRIKNGEYFSDLAKEYSEDSSKSKGGDIGFINRKSQLDKTFLDAAFALKVGDVSDVVRSVYGFHLITVTEKKVAMKYSFEDSKGSIKNELLKTKNDNALKEYIQKIGEKSNVEIFLGKSK